MHSAPLAEVYLGARAAPSARYTPSLAEVEALAADGQPTLVPVTREILADLETPVSAYLKVAQGPASFLLESVEGGERLARYSFIGTLPWRILRFREGQAEVIDAGQPPRREPSADPLRLVEAELRRWRYAARPDLPRLIGGAVGYLGYEMARSWERLPAPAVDPLALPEAVLLFVDTLLVFDHVRRRIKVVSHARLDGSEPPPAAYAAAVARIEHLVARLRQPLDYRPRPATAPVAGPAEVSANVTREQFEAGVVRALEHIRAGDIIQVVLAQRLARPTSASPFDIYRALRTINPSPYMYYLDVGEAQLVGTSPELLVRVEDGTVTTRPLAGTRRRGRDAAEDQALEAELLADEKERAEHIMLVDLGRNDLGRVSVPGTVQVTELMGIERYSHVMHIVSHVVGTLRPDMTAFDALRACFPAGTVSGAPKIRAMEIIAAIEPDRRGPYAGAVGYFSYSGNMDTAITIRTIVVKDGVAYVQAGAGIVSDSIPANEYHETLNKARAMLLAVEEAERLEAEACSS